MAMDPLQHSDYQRLFDFIAELQQPCRLADFGANIVRLTSGLVPESVIAFDQINALGSYTGFDHNMPLSPREQLRIHQRLQEVYTQNPIYAYIKSGGKGPVVDSADLMPIRAFQRTEFYQDIFRPYQLRNQVTVLLSRKGWITTLTINNPKQLGGRMKTMLALASRHIQLAHENAVMQAGGAFLSLGQSFPDLTRRELEVFSWLREGKRNAEIATILGCSPRTIEKHVESILRKTGAETRTGAVRNCLETFDPGL